MTVTDPGATAPATVTFAAGQVAFDVTLVTVGTRRVTLAEGARSAFQEASVVVSVPKSLTLAGLPATVTAGAAQSLTLTAKDAFGNVASDFNGAADLSSSDPAVVFSADPVTFNAGVATFTATLRTAGARTLTATVSPTLEVVGSTSVTPATAASFELTGLPAVLVAGTTTTLTAKAKDAFGNVATGYAGTASVTVTDPGATAPASITFVAGQQTFDVKLVTVGTRRVTITEGAKTTFQEASVTPAAAASFELTGLPAALVAGTTTTLTAKAKDAFGNVATGYTGTATVTVTDPGATAPASIAFVAGQQTLNVKLVTVGTRRVTITEGAKTTFQEASVTAGALAAVALSGPAGPTDAGVSFGLSLAGRDAQGNTLALSGSATVSVPSGCSGPASATLPPAALGTYTCSASGTKTFVATFGGFSDHMDVVVRAGAPSALVWTAYGNRSYAGAPLRYFDGQPLTVEVRDAGGNVSDAAVPVTVAFNGYNPTHGKLGGSLTVMSVHGRATFDDLTYDRAGSFNLAARSPGLTAANETLIMSVDWAPPTVTIDGISGGPSCWDVAYTVAQDRAAPVDVRVEYERDVGGLAAWYPASSVLAAATGPERRATSAAGRSYHFMWDAGADVAPGAALDTALRVTARVHGSIYAGSDDSSALSIDVSPTLAVQALTSAFAGTAGGPPIAADLDGDGRVDLARVVKNGASFYGLSIRFADGASDDLAFPVSGLALPSIAGHAHSGDARQAEIFFVPANTAALHVEQFLVQGPGTVTSAVPDTTLTPCGQSPSARIRDVIALDVDLDGKDELVVTCTTPNQLVVARRTEAWAFTTLALAAAPSALAAVDIDFDGLPEVAVGTDQGLLIASGLAGQLAIADQRSFAAVTDVVATQVSDSAANLPPDSAVDFVATSSNGSVYALRGDPSEPGTLGVPVVVGSAYGPIAAADVDGDGLTEVAMLDLVAGGLLVYASDGTFALEASSALPTSGDVIAADSDGDGRADLVAGSDTFLEVARMPRPAGCGLPAAEGPDHVRSAGAADLQGYRLADVDGDGWLDAVGVFQAHYPSLARTTELARGLGHGAFDVWMPLGGASQSRPTLADWNRDGVLDTAWTAADAAYAMQSSANGRVLRTLVASGVDGELQAGDIDGDDDDDLAVVGYSTFSWWANDGSGQLTAKGVMMDAPGRIQRSWLADLSGDGRLDPMAVVDVDGTLELCLARSSPTGWDSPACSALDELATGQVELAFTSYQPVLVTLAPAPDQQSQDLALWSFSFSFFSKVSSVSVPSECQLGAEGTDFALRDYDGDDAPDIFLRCGYSEGWIMHRDPMSYDYQHTLTVADASSLEDVDGDGRFDLVSAASEGLTVLSGRGASGSDPRFADGLGFVPASTDQGGAVVTDLDGDGISELTAFTSGVDTGDGTVAEVSIYRGRPAIGLKRSRQTLDDLDPVSFHESMPTAWARMGNPGLVVWAEGESELWFYGPTPTLGQVDPTPTPIALTGPLGAAAVADLDADGLDDLVGTVESISGQADALFVARQTLAGTFATPTTVLVSSGLFGAGLAVGDFAATSDGQAAREVAVLQGSAAAIGVYAPDYALSTLTPVGSHALPPNPSFEYRGLWKADLDGDGDDDLVVGIADRTEGGWTWVGLVFVRQTAPGVFVDAGSLEDPLPDDGIDVRLTGVVDLDRDGKPDLVAGGYLFRGASGLDFAWAPGLLAPAPFLGRWPVADRPAFIDFDGGALYEIPLGDPTLPAP
ncbi:MAG: FG-GAP-like repeat-containing protein [Myxococcota bacterium]